MARNMVLDKSNRKKPEHEKITNNIRDNDEKPQAGQTNNGPKANKDSVIFVGNSMIKYVNGCDISCSHTVQVGPNPGASTHDLMDYVKPAMRKKLKALVVHAGTKNF